MKNNLKMFCYRIIVIVCFNIIKGQCQLMPIIGPPNFGQTDPSNNIESIGIGDFNGLGSPTFPQSALHINTNLFGFSPSYNLGEVFRTDCPVTDGVNDISTYWRMYRGGVQYGKLYNLAVGHDYNNTQTGKGKHFYIEATGYDESDNSWGDLRFNTGQNPDVGNAFARMRILGSNGYVGIGEYEYFKPEHLLHVHQRYPETADAYAQFTNAECIEPSNWTVDALDGFKIGVTAINANLFQQENAPMFFYTNDGPTTLFGASTKERFRLTYNIGQGWPLNTSVRFVTKANISYGNTVSPISVPVALLNLGEDPITGAQPGAQRLWMDVGTFNCRQTDIAYFGLKREGEEDEHDAVVNWGDNIHIPETADGTAGANNLRFILTAPLHLTGAGLAGHVNGFEMMRISPQSHVGIGNFYAGNGSGIQPARRLEIYDKHLDYGIGTSEPQLRLTYSPSATVTNGIHTDIQNTSIGDLLINTQRMNGGSIEPHFVGINCSVGSPPLNTLEINSTALSPKPS